MKIYFILIILLLLASCDISEERYVCNSTDSPLSVKIKGKVLTYETNDFIFCQTEGNKNIYTNECEKYKANNPTKEKFYWIEFDTISKHFDSESGLSMCCWEQK